MPNQSAYLIFTSGSTGTPKGVVISHAALAHYASGVLSRLALPADVSMAMISTTAADLGHTVLFGALFGGHPLHLIARERSFSPDQFAAYMARHRVGVLKIVPSHLRSLLQRRDATGAVLPHAALIVGGEPTPADLMAQIGALRPGCALFNHYGPTETTVGVLMHASPARETGPMPLGLPLAGVTVHVLDADWNPLPPGIAGELYIGGPQLARGYLDQPAMTAGRFVPDPAGHGQRMYRTGDRVRQDADGRLHFLGRADEQVKVRGYRVEPGDVAQRLRAHPGVTNAVVLLHEDRLVAWCVLDGTDATALKASMKAELPDHMVPAQIIAVERIPITANGKLDRQSLPDPVFEAQGYVAPRTPTETMLARIWQTLLEVPRVGVHDNFFELGGHSLLITRLSARLNVEAAVTLPLKVYFDAATLAEMAEHIDAALAPAQGRSAGAWQDMEDWMDDLEPQT